MGNIDGLLNPKPSQEATIAITASFTFVTILFVLARSWIVRTKKKTRATR